MQAVANNPEFANKVGVNQSVGQEFTKEKSMKTKKMMGGGMADRRGRAMTRMGADAAGRAMMMNGGKVGYKAGGKVKKMNMGGATMGARGKTMADMKDMEGRAMAAGRLGASPAMMADARGRAMKNGGAVMKAKGKKMAYGGKVKKMKHGGAVKSSASKRADGIAQRGRTRGRIV